MFQIGNMEPEFQQKLIQRLLELQSRIEKTKVDGNVSTSLLKDLSALLKWSAKIGLLGESEVKNVQYNLNIVQKCTSQADIILNKKESRSLVYGTNPKCLIEMSRQNKSTKRIKVSQNYGTVQMEHTIVKRCIFKETRNTFAVENQLVKNKKWNKSLDDATAKRFIQTINSTENINIDGANKHWRARILSTKPHGNNKSLRKQWSTNRISSNRDLQRRRKRIVWNYKNVSSRSVSGKSSGKTFLSSGRVIINGGKNTNYKSKAQQIHGKSFNWNNESTWKKWKYKPTSKKCVLPYVSKVISKFKTFKTQNHFL